MVRTDRLTRKDDVLAGFELWNAQHPDFHIDDRFVEQNVYTPSDGVASAAWGVRDGGELIGFALAKHLTAEIPHYAGPETGWVSLMAIDGDRPDFETLGADLLGVAESHLAARGVTQVSVGTDVKHFLPGLPNSLVDRYGPLLETAGYDVGSSVYDVARDITDFERPDRVSDTRADAELLVRPLDPEDTDVLLGFLADQFPGRWHYSADNARQIPGGIQDYWGVWKGDALVAFAETDRCDAPAPGSNLLWGSRLSDRYCALGPIGVHEDERGNGYGLALISEAIESFREQGYTHMIIDWTTIVDYYAKLGFEPFLEYVNFSKRL